MGDRSDFGWGAIHHYQTDPLTDNSNDEKELRKADKVARWDYEKREAYFRRPQGGRIWNGRRGHQYNPYSVGRSYHQYHDSWDTPVPSVRRDTPPTTPKPLMSLTPLKQVRHKVLGPCFTCRAYEHLARTCPTKRLQYPFSQPVMTNADATCVPAESIKLSISIQGVDI